MGGFAGRSGSYRRHPTANGRSGSCRATESICRRILRLRLGYRQPKPWCGASHPRVRLGGWIPPIIGFMPHPSDKNRSPSSARQHHARRHHGRATTHHRVHIPGRHHAAAPRQLRERSRHLCNTGSIAPLTPIIATGHPQPHLPAGYLNHRIYPSFPKLSTVIRLMAAGNMGTMRRHSGLWHHCHLHHGQPLDGRRAMVLDRRDGKQGVKSGCRNF